MKRNWTRTADKVKSRQHAVIPASDKAFIKANIVEVCEVDARRLGWLVSHFSRLLSDPGVHDSRAQGYPENRGSNHHSYLSHRISGALVFCLLVMDRLSETHFRPRTSGTPCWVSSRQICAESAK